MNHIHNHQHHVFMSFKDFFTWMELMLIFTSYQSTPFSYGDYYYVLYIDFEGGLALARQACSSHCSLDSRIGGRQCCLALACWDLISPLDPQSPPLSLFGSYQLIWSSSFAKRQIDNEIQIQTANCLISQLNYFFSNATIWYCGFWKCSFLKCLSHWVRMTSNVVTSIDT